MRKILIAADGSKASEEAAWFLSHLPHRTRLDILIVSVVNPPHFSYRAYPTESWMKELMTREKRAAEQAASRIAEMFEGADVAIKHLMAQGPVGPTLVKVADREQVDLVAVGARGHSRVSRILLGSTSDYVATHAHCSVLVVRPTGLSGRSDPIRIAVTHEQSETAEAAIDEFRQTKWGHGADVSVVSVLPYLRGYLGEMEPDTQATDEALKALSQTAGRLKTSASDVKTRLIENEHVGEGIVRFLEDDRSDLAVLGETRRGMLGRLLMGSVSRYVLRHAPCSVWIARNRTSAAEQTEGAKDVAATPS